VTVHNYETEVTYNGKLYTVKLPEFRVPQCDSCSELVFGNDAGEQINVALRQQLELLQPEEIEQNLCDRSMSQKDLAAAIGVAEATVSRWKTGTVIQSKASDLAMREYFKRTQPQVEASADAAKKVGQLVAVCLSDVLDSWVPASSGACADWLCAQQNEWRELLGGLADQYAAGERHGLKDLVRMLNQRS